MVLALEYLWIACGMSREGRHYAEWFVQVGRPDPVTRVRLLLLTATALLTAVLVSVAGAIGFVGLVLPHAVRAVVGSGHRRLLPTTALAGAVFLVWVDTVARTAMDPQEIPVGVVTSLVGVPAFAVVLYRVRRGT